VPEDRIDPPTDSRLDSHRAVRLLRAKASELEGYVLNSGPVPVSFDVNLAADIALIAGLLADEIERANHEHRSIRDYQQ
jgi:hypothetical protein